MYNEHDSLTSVHKTTQDGLTCHLKLINLAKLIKVLHLECCVFQPAKKFCIPISERRKWME